ncbi:hypothetical protein AVO45_18730 [Ruegeria marisrubri]|uniref:Pentapeptide repeat-containing protein n=1 Tax=Ruegeria marisrubri TaxID=1685379 RepID=A0A0X3U430_9RHOB|nr:hypothetical protein AVO45_18730 [Ruegeria marisrubri]
MPAADIRARLAQPWRHGEHADFTGMTCDGLLDLRDMALAGVDFTGAHFPNGIDARGACFNGLSWFGEVSFGGPARFDNAMFTNDARFEGADFTAVAAFTGAIFCGIGRFDAAEFADGADFARTTCYGNFSLQSVTARGAVSFRDGEWLGGLWCDDARLPEDIDLAETQVHGRLWLKGALRGNAALQAGAFGMSFGYTYI